MAECQSKRYPPLYPRCHILAAKAQSSLKKLLLSSQLVSEETTLTGGWQAPPVKDAGQGSCLWGRGAGACLPAARGGQGPCGSSTPPPSGLRAPPGPGQRSPACPPPGSRTWRRPANPFRRLAIPKPPWAPSPESQHAPAHPGTAESLPRRRHPGLQFQQRNARPPAGGAGGLGAEHDGRCSSFRSQRWWARWEGSGDAARHSPRPLPQGPWARVLSAENTRSPLPLCFS